MLNTIIVPLDGSLLAECALPYAEAMVAGGQGSLLLVRAVTARALPGTDPGPAQLQVIEEAERYLTSIAERLASKGVSVETAVPYGPAASSILDEIRIRQADLVVMATHGRSGLGRWFFGSVAEQVLAQSAVPVMLVRAWQGGAVRESFVRPRRLVVPLDGSEFAEAALPVAADLATRLGAEIVLTEVVLPPPVQPLERGRLAATVDQVLDSVMAQADTYLGRQADSVQKQVADLEISTDVRIGAPVDAIVAASDEHEGTLVVMATHGRTGLNQVLLGSVALAVLRHGDAPLVLIRPRALPPASTILAPAPAEQREPGPVIQVNLTGEDLALIRTGLQTLSRSVTRHERLYARIDELLERLPPAREPATTGY